MKFTSLILIGITSICFFQQSVGKTEKQYVFPKSLIGKEWGCAFCPRLPLHGNNKLSVQPVQGFCISKVNFCKCSCNMEETGKTSYKDKTFHTILVLECQNNENFIVNFYVYCQNLHKKNHPSPSDLVVSCPYGSYTY